MHSSAVDLSPLINALVGIGAIALTAFGSWALARVAAYFKISNNSVAMQAFDDALTRAIHAGADQAQGIIAAKGWDHVDTQSAIVAAAAPYMIAKFAPALTAIGLDPSNSVATTAYITAELNRIFPTAIAAIAASPVTPPVPSAQPLVLPVVDPIR